MARESFVVNGTLDLMAGVNWDVDELVVSAPAPVGDDPVVAGRTGSLWYPKVLGESTIQVSMWVGNPGVDRAVVWGYWEQIAAVIAQPSALLDIVWTLSDGATRTCQAELVNEPSPQRLGTKGYLVDLEFTVPSGVWTHGP